MTRIKSFARIAAVTLVIAALAVPGFAARGTADFTRFVAIGDSYGAGFEAGSLNARHQPFGWPAIVARQAGLKICEPTAGVGPLLPDSDRIGVSFGVGYHHGPFIMDLSEFVLHFKTRSTNGLSSDNFNGTYKTDANLISINFGYRF